MDNVAVLMGDGAFALFFPPHPGGIWQLKSPHPGEFAIQGETNANGRGSARTGTYVSVYFWLDQLVTSVFLRPQVFAFVFAVLDKK